MLGTINVYYRSAETWTSLQIKSISSPLTTMPSSHRVTRPPKPVDGIETITIISVNQLLPYHPANNNSNSSKQTKEEKKRRRTRPSLKARKTPLAIPPATHRFLICVERV